MPTYQYACTDCGDRSEVVQRFTDDPLTVCSACGGKLRKVFSPVGIVFKGSGFYRTDSRNGSNTVPAGKDAGRDKDKDSSASSSNGSGSSSSESSSGSSDKSSSGSGGDKSGSGSSGSTSSGSTSSSSGSKSATPVS